MKKFPFLILALGLLGAQGRLRPEEPSRIFAAGKGAAYYMDPPELAARAFARRLAWSADGSHLLVERVVTRPGAGPDELTLGRETRDYEGLLNLSDRVQLVSWNRRTRSSETLVEFDPQRAKILAFEPMAASDRFLVTLSEAVDAPDGTRTWRAAYVLFTSGAGHSTRLWTQAPGEPPVNVELSPRRALGALVRHDAPGGPATVAFFGPDGQKGRPVVLGPRQTPTFAADGAPGVSVQARDAQGKWRRGFFYLDPDTGEIGKPAVEAGFEEETLSPPPLATAVKGSEVRLAVAGGDPDERGLVTSDGAAPALSPGDDAVAYLSGGNAYVRTLVKVDRKAYDATLLAAGRQLSMRYAKEAGTALSLYAADADDAFPPGGDIPNVVGPYALDREALRALVYSFGGGVPPGEKATTEIGYVPGPGGRAVVYADGSVRWIPDGG